MVKPLVLPIALRSIDRRSWRKFQTGELWDRFIQLSAALVLIMTFVARPAVTWAHGSAPAVLSVLSDDEAASRIRLTVGLAEATNDGWRWVCPASWGGPETPVVANTAAGMLVFGDEGIVRVNEGVGVFIEDGGDLNSSTVRAAASDGETVFVVARIDDDDLLLSTSGEAPTVVAQLQGSWQSLDVREGSPVLSAVRDGRLLVSELRPQGTGLSEQAYELGLSEGATASLRVRGAQTFVVVNADGDYRLFELVESVATEVFASSSLIHGPMPIGDSLLAVSDGALWELGENSRVLDDRVRYTCASWSPSGAFACSQTALFRVYEGGAATIATFQHADLRPPLESTGSCQGEWLDYAGHAGIELGEDPVDGGGEGEEPDENPAPKSGCSSVRSSFPIPYFTLLALFAIRRPRTHC